MSGRMSRTKGRRGEQQLVLYLKSRGYAAERILNQAHTPGLPDVKASKEKGVFLTFEVKTYRKAFSSIYQYYYQHLGQNKAVGMALDSKTLVAISTDLEEASTSGTIFNHPHENETRLFNKVCGLKSKKGIADYLVLKDNGKPRLFLKYYE